jgi:hypothetical protein
MRDLQCSLSVTPEVLALLPQSSRFLWRPQLLTRVHPLPLGGTSRYSTFFLPIHQAGPWLCRPSIPQELTWGHP